MKLNFCTLFDSGYLTRGLALHQSLLRFCPDFHLYIFAFDDKAFRVLRKLKLKNVTVIPLSEFEDKELLRVKPTRSRGEYCWTASSSTILYVLENFKVDHCTYVDADLYFYSDPSVLIEEMGKNSVLITEHRYSPQFQFMESNGKYCVQFMPFKNNRDGLKVLKWWRNACLDWCYGYYENGKFGDQKYLDTWTKVFRGVHELVHLGGGVAPWNLQQYELFLENEKIFLRVLKSGKIFPLVFYHFHDLRFFDDATIQLTGSIFELKPQTSDILYPNYIRELYIQKKRVEKIDESFDPNASRPRPQGGGDFFKKLIRKVNDILKTSDKNDRKGSFRFSTILYAVRNVFFMVKNHSNIVKDIYKDS